MSKFVREKPYRVIYYTLAGVRYKDFDDLELAQEFCNRHIKKYPEYQDTAWSRTELVDFTLVNK